MAASTPPRLGLRRAARIKHRRDFARVREEGGRLAIGCLIANWRCLPADARSRLGVIHRLGLAAPFRATEPGDSCEKVFGSINTNLFGPWT